MNVTLDGALALLGRTPALLDVLLCDLPEVWTQHNEGPRTWSPVEIVGHLLYAERVNWMPRARMMREKGCNRQFPAFDRLGHQKEFAGVALDKLLPDFARARSESLEELHSWNLTEHDLGLGGRHPTLGEVTLSQLLSAWAVHDLTHLHQISRAMAYQYRDAVGPWRQYLGVLHCMGHGG